MGNIESSTLKELEKAQKEGRTPIIVDTKGGELDIAIELAQMCSTPVLVKRAISAGGVFALLIKSELRFCEKGGFLLLHEPVASKKLLTEIEAKIIVDKKIELVVELQKVNPQIHLEQFSKWLKKGICFADTGLAEKFFFKVENGK
jgi:carbamoylphosphate synthase large subunit